MIAYDGIKPMSNHRKKRRGKLRENVMRHKVFGTAILAAGNTLKV